VIPKNPKFCNILEYTPKKALEGEKLTIRLVALRVARRPRYLSPWCLSPQGREGRGTPCEEIYRNEILLESEKNLRGRIRKYLSVLHPHSQPF